MTATRDPLSERRMLVAETLGSVFWLLMDAAWMMDLTTAATALVVPALLGHLVALACAPRTWIALAVTGSTASWLAMNVCWMLGEVHEAPGLLVAARGFAAAGVLLLAFAFYRSRWAPEARIVLLSGFRRLRVGSRAPRDEE